MDTETRKYIGSYYGEMNEIPVKSGMTVIIPKGTPFRSMHPSHRNKDPVAKRTYKVKVHRVSSGQTVTLGRVYQGRHIHSGATERELIAYCRCLGLLDGDCYSQKDVDAAIKALYTRCEERRPGKWGGEADIILHLENPRVHWAGAGGYWCDADVNDVIIPDEKGA